MTPTTLGTIQPGDKVKVSMGMTGDDWIGTVEGYAGHAYSLRWLVKHPKDNKIWTIHPDHVTRFYEETV